MKAGVLAALNADRPAPMLAAADLGLVGRWRESIGPLLGALG